MSRSSMILHSELADDKEDLGFLKRTLENKKKWVMAAAGLLVVGAVAATSIAVSGGTSEANQSSGIQQTTPVPTPISSPAGETLVGSTGSDVPSSEVPHDSESLVLNSTIADINATNSSSTEIATESLEATNSTKSPTTESPTETPAATTTPAPTTTTPAPTTTTPAPTTTLPKLPYTDIKFNWLDIGEWQGDNEIKPTFAASAFKKDRIEVSTFGKPYQQSYVLRTTKGWSGLRAIFIEWTSYDGSDTNIWMLPTHLKSQFATTAWPKCGEYDIFEMFNGDAAIGHSGTQNLWFGGGLTGFGQSTLHMASTNCWAAFYPDGKKRPSSSSQSAQWQTSYGAKNSMVVIFGADGNGKYIQQVQNPKIVYGADDSADILFDGANPAEKIYTNGQKYWGVDPVGGCAPGYDGGAGFPFITDEFRLVLQEQYLGKFDVTNIKIFKKN